VKDQHHWTVGGLNKANSLPNQPTEPSLSAQPFLNLGNVYENLGRLANAKFSYGRQSSMVA
jgi:hypothetical protein